MRFRSNSLAGVFLAVFSLPAVTLFSAGVEGGDPDDGLASDRLEAPVQVGKGELVFLSPRLHERVPHSSNRIVIHENSLVDGLVSIRQCYRGLDAVPAAEIVYQYRNMQKLRIESTENIAEATVLGNRVQLYDVHDQATLCIGVEAEILYPQPDGSLILRNGPFYRRFLDGWFPLHVTLDVVFPGHLLRHIGSSPSPVDGIHVNQTPDSIQLDAWFAGELTIEMRFRQTGP